LYDDSFCRIKSLVRSHVEEYNKSQHSLTDSLINDMNYKDQLRKKSKIDNKPFRNFKYQSGFITSNTKHFDQMQWKNKIELTATSGINTVSQAL